MYDPYSIFQVVHHLDFMLWHYLHALNYVWWFPFGHCRSVVGELDEDLDSNLDLSKLRAHPL